MNKISLNDRWEYAHLGMEDWKEITLPHDAMLHEPRRADAPGGKNVGYFEGRDYIYRRTLSIEKKEGARYLLEFEGVYRKARISLNGKEVAFRPYGYTDFYVDITDECRTGENFLSVVACNSDQPNSRWYSGAGIYRPVWLYELPERHILPCSVRISTLDYEKGEIAVSCGLSHGGAVRVEIFDGEQPVACGEGTELRLTIPAPKLWSAETPFLYTCKVTYFSDIRTITFGIRKIEWDAKRGFLINGKRTILRGACIHHDNGILGACAYPEAEERKVRLLKEAGYNALRSAHNPCSKALLDACDRLGMYILDEYADMWYIHKCRYDYANELTDWWKEDLKDLVNKDRNHPSVIMYSTGNEVGETSERRGIELVNIFTQFLHSLDDRPVTCGINVWFNAMYRLGFGQYSDKKAERGAKKGKKYAVGSEFFNNLTGRFGAGFMKTMAKIPICGRVSREAFAGMDIAGYNYGIKRYRKDMRKFPSRMILGTETFCADAYSFMQLAEKYPAIVGDFVWSGMDYLGEVGVGALEYSDYAKNFMGDFGWISAGSGRLDLTGRGAGESLYTKVAFGLLPISIAAIPADRANRKHSPSAWALTNARPSWSFHGNDGKKTTVEVYTRAVRVKLFINNRKVGDKKRKKGDCRILFRVTYRTGSIVAIGYDEKGAEICRTSLISAGKETKLRLEPEQKEVKRGGLLFVRLRFTDDAGTTKLLVRGEITLDVRGGTLLAFGNGCPYNESGYLSGRSDTYYGEALAVIRAEGEVHISAVSQFGNACMTVPEIEEGEEF